MTWRSQAVCQASVCVSGFTATPAICSENVLPPVVISVFLPAGSGNSHHSSHASLRTFRPPLISFPLPVFDGSSHLQKRRPCSTAHRERKSHVSHAWQHCRREPGLEFDPQEHWQSSAERGAPQVTARRSTFQKLFYLKLRSGGHFAFSQWTTSMR